MAETVFKWDIMEERMTPKQKARVGSGKQIWEDSKRGKRKNQAQNLSRTKELSVKRLREQKDSPLGMVGAPRTKPGREEVSANAFSFYS